MSWSRRLWRTLPIALVIVLAAATAAFAGEAPTSVNVEQVTGFTAGVFPAYCGSGATVQVKFGYISNPDNPGTTEARVLLLDGSDTEVGSTLWHTVPDGDKTALGDWQSLNVVTPTGAPDATQYKIVLQVANSNSSPNWAEDIQAPGLEVDLIGPGPVSGVYVTGGVPTSDNTPQFIWSDAADDRAGIRSYWVEVDHSPTAPASAAMTDTMSDGHIWTSGALADGTDWYFHIRAQDKAFNYGEAVTFGPFEVDTMPPSVPTNLVGAMGSADLLGKWRMNDTTPTVIWDASTDAGVGLHSTQPYQVQIGTMSTTSDLEGPSFAAGPTYTATGPFVEGTEYFVQVRAQDALGNWSDWVYKSFFHDPTPPTDPSAIGLTNSVVVGADNWTNDSTPEFTWNDSTDTQAMHATAPHNVKIGTQTGLSDLLGVTGTGDSPYTAADLGWTTGDEYFFNVQGQDAAGNVSAFEEYKFKFDGLAPTFTDTPVTGTVGAGGHRYTNDTTPTISWTAATDVGSGLASGPNEPYEIRIGTDYGLQDVLTPATSIVNSYTPGGALALTNGVTYYIQVRAKDEAGNWSEWADCQGTFIYDNAGPSVPANLVGATGSLGLGKWRMNDTTPTVNWDASTDTGVGLHASQPYEFQIGLTTGASDHVALTPVNALTYTVDAGKAFTQGTDYYVQVRAKDALNNTGGWQEVVFVHDETPPADPSSIGLTDSVFTLGSNWTNDSTPVFTWTDSTDVQAIHATAPHRVKIGTATTLSDLLGVTGAGDSPYTAANLGWTTGNEYFFNVQGQDAAGNVSAFVEYAFKFDGAAPVVTGSPTTGVVGAGGHRYTNLTQPPISWTAATDGDSGLAGTPYEIRIGTEYGLDDVLTTATSVGSPYAPGAALTLNNGVTYYIQVRAKDAVGNWSAWADCQGAFIYDDLAPSAPANIRAATGSAGAAPDTAWHTPTQQPTIQWDASIDAGVGLHGTAPYKIKIGTTLGGTETLGETTCSTNSYALGVDLTAGTKYYVNVTALDALGNETGYHQRVMYYDVTPPGDPGAPEVGTDFGGTRWTNDLTPRVDWGNSTDTAPGEMHQTERYTLKIGSTSGAVDILGETFVTSVMYIPSSDLSLTTGDTYYVNVKAKDAANIENTFGYVQGTFKFDNTPPTIAGTPMLKAGSPAVIRESVVYTNAVTPDLDWEDGNDGVGVGLPTTGAYEVKVGSTSGGLDMLAVTATDDSELDHAGLAPMTNGNTYHVSVRVQDQLANWSATADPWYVGSFVFDNEGPTPPGTPTTGVLHGATYYTDDLTPQIDWAASTDALSGMPTTGAYEIKIGSTQDASDVLLATLVDSNTYTPGGDLVLTDGNTYYISVRAFDALGNLSHAADPWVRGEFVYDSGAPQFANAVPVDGYETNEPNPAISIDITDAGSGVDSTTIYWTVTHVLTSTDVDTTDSWADPTATCALTTPLTTVAQEGAYSIQVVADDSLGNHGEYPVGTWEFVFDMTPPTLDSSTVSTLGDLATPYVDADGKVYTNTNMPTLTFNVADALSGFDGDGHGEIVVKDKSENTVSGIPGWTPNGLTATATWSPMGPMADGEYTATLTVDDDAENEAVFTYTFRIDRHSPYPVASGSIWAGNQSAANSNWYTNSRRPTWHWGNPGDPDVEMGVPGSQIKNYDLYLVKNKGIGETTVDATLGGTNGVPIVVPTSETDWEVWQPAGDLPLVAGDEIGVYIRARDNATNKTAYVDPPLIFDPDPPAVPGTPTTTTPTVDRTPTWSWAGSTDAISGVDEYHIQIRHFGTADWDVLDTVLDIPDSLTPTDPQTWTQGLSLADGQYEIRVRAMDVAGNYSDWSGIGSVTVDATPPAAPAIQALDPGYTTSPITINWNDVTDGSNAITYVLQYADNAGFDVATSVPRATSDYPFSFPDELEYWFRVKTISTVNVGETKESGWSPIVSTIFDHTGPDAPELMLLTPHPTNQSPQTWSWTAPAGATRYEVQADDDAWINVNDTRTYQTTFNTTGTHYFRVRAYDWLDNEGPVVEGTVEVDVTAPDVPTGLTVVSPTTDKTPTWSWTAVSGAAGYEIRLDETIIRDVATAVSYTHAEELGDRGHTLEVRSYDTLGNKSAWCAPVTVTVDTLPPAAPAIQALDPGYKTSPITINWNDVTDGANAIAYVLEYADNAGFSGATSVPCGISNYPFSFPDELEYWFRVKTISTVNVGETKESGWSPIVSTIYDHTGPAAPVLMLLTPDPTNESPQTWSWSAPAGATRYEVKADDGAWINVDDTRTYQTTFATTGTHTFKVKAYDWLDNEGPEVAVTVYVDLAAPAVPTGLELTEPAGMNIGGALYTADETPKVKWDAVGDADLDHYVVEIDGQAWITVLAPDTSYTFSEGLADGDHTVKVKAVDELGNDSDYSDPLHFTVDTTPPAVPGMPQTTSPTKNQSPVWTWGTVADAAKYRVFEDEVDKGFVTATTYTSDNLAEGTHYLQVTALDALSNESAKSEAGYVVIDLTPPGAPVMKTLPRFTNAATVRFEWTKSSADTDHYEISYSVDGGEEWSAPLELAGEFFVVGIEDVADGVAVSGRVRAYDEVGNVSAWSDGLLGAPIASTIVDRTGPVVAITNPTEPVFTNAATFTYEWTAIDAGCGVRGYTVVFNGGKHEVTETSDDDKYAYEGTLNEGDNTFEVVAVDNLGNKSAVVAKASVVKQVKPQIGLVQPMPGGRYKINEISTIAFMVTGLYEAPIQVSVNNEVLDPWRIVTVVNEPTLAKFYVLLDGEVLLPGPMAVTITVGSATVTHNYTVDSERSGFGFGRLRLW